MTLAPSAVDILNTDCDCLSLDATRTKALLTDKYDLPEDVFEGRDGLLAETPVFVAHDTIDQITRQVALIEQTLMRADFTPLAEARLGHPLGPVPDRPALFMGYDFHIRDGTPHLIEINTNAGGAFLVSAANELARIHNHSDCCQPDRIGTPQQLIDTFLDAAGRRTPQGVAIVDETPKDQYLRPDMLIAARMLTDAGIPATVASPSDLIVSEDRVLANGMPVDFIYNRMTDFTFSSPISRPLRNALDSGLVTISPDPRHHQRYANKGLLTVLTDDELPSVLGLSTDEKELLSAIPTAMRVTSEQADQLWRDRRNYVFKPIDGYGSRGVFRGDKLTKGVWADIQNASYIAQRRILPGARLVTGKSRPFKFDIRAYAFDGRPLLFAARLYEGQVTNFRTVGGGLAPVISDPRPTRDADHLSQHGL